MDLIPSLSAEYGPVIRLVLVIVAVIVALAILRYVVNIAVSLFRTAVWIGVVIIVLYIIYGLLRARGG